MRHGESDPPHESRPAVTDESQAREEAEVWAYEVDDHSFDICYDLYVSVPHEDAPFSVSLWYDHPAEGTSTLEDLIGELVFNDSLPDDRAPWHRNTGPLEPILRAHVLRLAKGWREKRLAQFFETNPEVAYQYGFVEPADDGTLDAAPMKQSRLWELWNESLPEVTKAVCRAVLSEVVVIARDHGIPVPHEAFQPVEQTGRKQTKAELHVETLEKVWGQAKPIITQEFSLNRGPNWQIHENRYFEQHAYMGSREDMYAESGHKSFLAATDRRHERPPTGSSHRHQIGKLTIAGIRAMFQNTAREIVRLARYDSELVGKLWVAIDVTKGREFFGDIEGYEDEILGYKDLKRYFQWAVIKIIGFDVPIILDVIPRVKGQTKAEIVDELLTTALDLTDGVELVLMDSEFDSDGVKDVCAAHGVHNLNPAKLHANGEEMRIIRWMKRNNIDIHVVERETPEGMPTRKQIFVPKSTVDEDADENENGADDDCDGDTAQSERDSSAIRDDLMNRWGVALDDDETSGHDEARLSPVGEVLAEICEDEDERASEIVGTAEESDIVVFDTSHPAVTEQGEGPNEMDGMSFIQMAARTVRWYRHRWGIENGFKKLKHFMVQTTSKRQQYRFFNFVFACVLYNVWRLVDLLVTLALKGEYATYEPTIDANLFLTVTDKYYGWDPPD
ncbi:transposase [Halomarina litorea]|uniref:transposase n=1 Tax=Halomarina litorea TaxID=2961595 RepID=UPI0020C29033|nr:transposase [Halomarina sp. BCD28]